MPAKTNGELEVVPGPKRTPTIIGGLPKFDLHKYRNWAGPILFFMFAAILGQACAFVSSLHVSICR